MHIPTIKTIMSRFLKSWFYASLLTRCPKDSQQSNWGKQTGRTDYKWVEIQWDRWAQAIADIG